MNKLKLVGIKTKDGLYISTNIKGESYYSPPLNFNKFKFNNQLPDETYLKDWFFIKDIPLIIEKYFPKCTENIRYELKKEYPVTDMTPLVVYEKDLNAESSFYGIISLYDRVGDEVPEHYENIEFEINIIDSIDNFKPVQQEYPIESSLLDKITTHSVLLSTKPCNLSIRESYKIIRDYIKSNIDPNWAKITSDYDFCFTVKKLILLDEPESYQVNIADINNWSRRKRKPRYETRYQKNREVEIFEMAPAPYQGYTIIKPFRGNNYEDLMNNINTFLKELIDKINEPLVDCPCCKGLGVILDKR